MKKEILIIDYNSEVIEAIKEILYQDFFEITAAGDELVAKTLLNKKKFDLVIIEALLPKAHGLLLSQYISAQYPGTRVILMSDKYTVKDFKSEALKYGACDFFEKPLDPVQFKNRIIECLSMSEKVEAPVNLDSQTTNVHILPLLDQLDVNKYIEKHSAADDFRDIIKDVKKLREPYEIKLD